MGKAKKFEPAPDHSDEPFTEEERGLIEYHMALDLSDGGVAKEKAEAIEGTPG